MLPERPERWVLDASVAINLLAMPDPGRVITALGVPCVIPTIAAKEVQRSGHPKRQHLLPYDELVKFLNVVELDAPELELFGELVGATSPNDLDDGEAAVLAVATCRGGACLLDERKCLRIARERVPPMPTRTTVDVLRWCASSSFAHDEIVTCLVGALQFARMRIPPEHLPWVREMLGPDRCAEFPSLRGCPRAPER